MNIEGTLIVDKGTVHVTDSFKKREFVIEFSDNPLYPQKVIFQLVQDRCEMLDQYYVGQGIAVTFNLRGREWISPQGETKFFNSLEAWKLDPVQTATNAPQSTQGQNGRVAPTNTPNANTGQINAPVTVTATEVEGDSDGLPF